MRIHCLVDIDDVGGANGGIQRCNQLRAIAQHGSLIDRAFVGDFAVIE